MSDQPINLSIPRNVPGPTTVGVPAFIPNPHNLILAQKHSQLVGAQRFALATTCDPLTKEPTLTRAQIRQQLKTITISAGTGATGSSSILPAGAGVRQVYELFLWNVTKQTISVSQGAIPWFTITDCPDAFGYLLGFNGNFEQSHFDVDNNSALTLTLQHGTHVDGFIRYRVANGTY